MENRGIGENVEIPPTEEEIPYSDGLPMESERHFFQMSLGLESLKLAWKERDDFYAGGDMFVYFSLDQVKGRDFRGPDFFVVLGVPRRERKSWVWLSTPSKRLWRPGMKRMFTRKWSAWRFMRGVKSGQGRNALTSEAKASFLGRRQR